MYRGEHIAQWRQSLLRYENEMSIPTRSSDATSLCTQGVGVVLCT